VSVRAVFLDAGGVFTLPPLEPLLSMFESLGVETGADRLARAHHAGMAAFDLGLAEEGAALYMAALAREMGLPENRIATDIDVIRSGLAGQGWTVLIPGSIEGLRTIAATGRRLAIVSNSDGTVEQRLREWGVCQVGPGKGVEMDIVVDSAAVGVAKPDPAIFDFALRATGTSPVHAVHVGDSVRMDVAGARAAGIRPLHLDPFGFCAAPDHEHVRTLEEVARLVGDAG
jgi:putative hydrolase of the HAD superfamily